MHCCKILLDRTSDMEDHPCHGFLPSGYGGDGTSIRVISCSMVDQCTGHSIIEIYDDTGRTAEEDHEDEFGACNISRVGKNRYMAMITNRRCRLIRLVNESRCVLVSAIPQTDNLVEWTLIGPSSTHIHDLLRKMRESGYTYMMQSSNSVSDQTTLTHNQEETFNLAMDLGYYDIPKRIGLDDLSKVIGCSKSTLTVTLRTAEKKIFDLHRLICTSHMYYR